MDWAETTIITLLTDISGIKDVFRRIGMYERYINIWPQNQPYSSIYRKTSDISRTLAGNKIVDNSDVVGAAPTGDAPTTSELSRYSSFSTQHWLQWFGQRQLQGETRNI